MTRTWGGVEGNFVSGPEGVGLEYEKGVGAFCLPKVQPSNLGGGLEKAGRGDV